MATELQLAFAHYEDMVARHACGDRSVVAVSKARERIESLITWRSDAVMPAAPSDAVRAQFEQRERQIHGSNLDKTESGEQYAHAPTEDRWIGWCMHAALSQTMQPQADRAPSMDRFEHVIQWVRDNYQDHSIASLCDGLRAAYYALCHPAEPAAGEQAGAVDEIEQLREQRDALRRALEVIAVGDSPDPVRDAGDELVGLGYWRKEGLAGHRALAAPGAAIAAREQEALTSCREAFKQIRAHCWPFPLNNDAGKSISMEKIDKADRLALAALASRKEAPATPQAETAELFAAANEALELTRLHGGPQLPRLFEAVKAIQCNQSGG